MIRLKERLVKVFVENDLKKEQAADIKTQKSQVSTAIDLPPQIQSTLQSQQNPVALTELKHWDVYIFVSATTFTVTILTGLSMIQLC